MHEPGLCQPDKDRRRIGTKERVGERLALQGGKAGEYQDNHRVNHMQNVSPKTGNEEAGRDGAEGNAIKNHVTVPGSVNVEQIISSPEKLSGVGGRGRTMTLPAGYQPENRGAAP